MPPKVYMSSVCIVRPPIVYGIFPPLAVEQTLKFCQRRPVALFVAATSQKSLADPPVTPWICIEYSTIENTLQIHWQISHFSFSPPQIAPLMDRWFKCFTDYVVCPLCCRVGWLWPYFPQVYFKDGIPEILPPGKAQVAPRHWSRGGAKRPFITRRIIHTPNPHIRPQKFSMEFSEKNINILWLYCLFSPAINLNEQCWRYWQFNDWCVLAFLVCNS